MDPAIRDVDEAGAIDGRSFFGGLHPQAARRR